MKNCLLIFLFFIKCLSASEIPIEAKNAITEALKGKWVFRSFELNKKSMGFDSTTKLSDIKIGDPFQMFVLSQEVFENANENVPVDSLITAEDWFVPLYVNDKLQETVMVIGTHFGENEKWSAGARSAKALVQAWAEVKKAWPESKGYHPKFIWIHSNEHSVCFFIPEKGENNLTIFGTYYLRFTLSKNVDFAKLSLVEETLGSMRSQQKEHERKSDSMWKEQVKNNDVLVKELEKQTEPLWKDLEMNENKSPVWNNDSIANSFVTSWWNDLLVQADSAIIPATFIKIKSDSLAEKAKLSEGAAKLLNINDNGVILNSRILKAAITLRAGARPIDQMVAKGNDQWYKLYAEDGQGFIRIGATGPLLIDDAPYVEGKPWGPGGSRSSYGGPQSGADLIEISAISITQQAIIWRAKTAYLKITTASNTPVSFRISFVSELPVNRTGCAYGPGVAANQYIMAVANGNITDLYRTTRIHYTIEQATKLRETLFKTKDQLNSFWQHRKPGALEVNAEGKLHVQHIILSSEKSSTEGKHWAFRIICFQRDGLWLVAEASRDPELSEKQVAEIVDNDFHRQH